MPPTTHKALFLLDEQSHEWVIRERPVSTPGPKDLLIKITATALNPVDWKIQSLGYFVKEFPYVGGTDAAGLVEEVGSEVTNFAKGDRVLFQGWFDNPRATFQQYAVVAAEIAAKIPNTISTDQAATVALALATVVTGLYNHNPQAKSISVGFPAPWEEGGTTKFAGQPVFIIGGASSVGQYAIQVTKLSGFFPIIATASLRHEAFLKSLGATHVIDRTLSAAAIQAEVTKIGGGKPIELVYDAISLADTQPLAYDVLVPGGYLVLSLPDIIPAKKAGDNKTIVSTFGNVQTPENREVGVALYSRLTEWLETGKLVPNRVEVVHNGLAGIIDGLERMKNDQVSGTKLVAHPQETV